MTKATQAASQDIARMSGRFRVIAFDSGTEFHDYEALERQFGVICYFATPSNSLERGAKENLNRLLRWPLPKGH